MAASVRVRLRRTLLRIGGVDVDFLDGSYLQVITDVGAPFVTEARLIRKGQINGCHRNAAALWLQGKCATVAVGYYPGPDQVWRQHSWSVMHDGAILDTSSVGVRTSGLV